MAIHNVMKDMVTNILEEVLDRAAVLRWLADRNPAEPVGA